MKLLEKWHGNIGKPSFYWIVSPDMPGFMTACVFKNKVPPYFSVGLGADLGLEESLYKALMESVGVNQLAKILMLDDHVDSNIAPLPHQEIFDLDQNVNLYARSPHSDKIIDKFYSAPSIDAKDLPKDPHLNSSEQLSLLLNAFSKSGKRLIYMDLTTQEASDLGLVVSRVWSPDMLTLAIPSAVPKQHPRFKIYGGVTHDSPHPYP